MLGPSALVAPTYGVSSLPLGRTNFYVVPLALGKTFTFKTTNQEFKVKQDLNCHSKFLMYVMTYAGCGKNFIGETKSELRERMTQHRQQIRDTRHQVLPVSAHIARCAINKDIKFTVFPFYKMRVENYDERRVNEQYFIDRFRPNLYAN